MYNNYISTKIEQARKKSQTQPAVSRLTGYCNHTGAEKFEDLEKNWDLGKFLGFEKKIGILEKKLANTLPFYPPLIFPFFVIRGGKTVMVSDDCVGDKKSTNEPAF